MLELSELTTNIHRKTHSFPIQIVPLNRFLGEPNLLNEQCLQLPRPLMVPLSCSLFCFLLLLPGLPFDGAKVPESCLFLCRSPSLDFSQWDAQRLCFHPFLGHERLQRIVGSPIILWSAFGGHWRPEVNRARFETLRKACGWRGDWGFKRLSFNKCLIAISTSLSVFPAFCRLHRPSCHRWSWSRFCFPTARVWSAPFFMDGVLISDSF